MAKSTPAQPKSDKIRANWDDKSEAILLEGLKKSVANGERAENGFKPQTYQAILGTLREQSYKFDLTQVKSRWTRFKTAHTTVEYLRGLSGFGWDESMQCVTASDDVWDRLLYETSEDGTKVKKRKFNDYNYYRTHNLPQYKEIAEIKGNTAAEGNYAFSSTSGSSAAPAASQDDRDEPVTGHLAGTDDHDVDDAPEPENLSPKPSTQSQTPTTQKHKYESPSTPQRPRKRLRASTSGQLSTLVDSVDRLIDGILSPSKRSPGRRKLLLVKAWDIVKDEEGLSPRSLAKARKVFRASDDITEEYLSFDSLNDLEREARSFWLQDEMDKLSQ